MKAGRRVAIVGAAVAATVALVNLAASVVTSYLPKDAPGWLRPPWIWLSLGVLAGLAATLAAIAVVQGRRADNAEPLAPSERLPVLSRANGTPNSLRPPRPGTSVHGRTDPLARLDAAIAEPDGRFVVICAIGGIGKTTLAAEAARRAERAGRRVFWISWQHDPETLAAQMVKTALALGLPGTRVQAAQQSGAGLTDLIWAHLEGVRGWVLVIDNLDEPAALTSTGEQLAHYRGWIRPGGGGLLIVTSRDREPSTWGEQAQLLILDPLSAEDGSLVLLDAAPRAGTRKDARALSARLGGLPLALQAAGAVLTRPTGLWCTFAAYQQALSERMTSVLPDRPDVSDPEVARRLVGYTWELSLDQLSADGLPRARTLLRLLALFHDAPIPRSVITPGLLTAVTAEPVSLEVVDRILTGLHRYGLIDVPDTTRTHDVRTVTMHRLVREANAELLARSTDLAPWHDAVSQQLIRQVNDTASTGQAGWNTARLLAPHLPLLTGLGNAPVRAFAPARDAVNTLADQLRDAGDYAVEHGLREACLTATQDHLGSDHPETLQCRDDLAGALHSLGHYRRAVEVHENNLPDRQRILGSDHPDTLDSRHHLAVALQSLGEYRRAAEQFEQTLADRQRILGLDHPDTLGSRHSLASALYSLGEYRRAAELFEQIVADRQRILGPEHPDTLHSRHHLAEAVRESGQYQRAVELDEQTLADRQRLLGPDHPDTLHSQHNLASALQELGHYQRAAQLFQRTVARRSLIIGLNHPDTLDSRHNLAIALRSLGRYQRAFELDEQTLADYQRILGPDHPDTLDSRHNLAVALQALGEYQRAFELFEQTLADRLRFLGPDHPDTLDSRNNLAVALQALGEYRRAVELFEQTLADYQRIFGPDHPNTLRSRRNLIAVLHVLGEFERADEVFKQGKSTQPE